MRLTADGLRRLLSAILKSGGSAGGQANLVAEHLVQAYADPLRQSGKVRRGDVAIEDEDLAGREAWLTRPRRGCRRRAAPCAR